MLCGAAMAAAPPQHGTPTAIFATDTSAHGHGKIVPGIAATVDGHPIALSDVELLALRNDRSYIVDQMIQNYVVDRDSKRRGIVVTGAEIDGKVAELRKAVAPRTVASVLAEHHVTMTDVREDFRQSIERERLVENQIPLTKMLHCRAIVVKFCPVGEPSDVAGTKRTQAQADAIVKEIQAGLGSGASFAALAKKYGESQPNAKSGDLGVIFDGIHNVDEKLVPAALDLGSGETTQQPITLASGSAYCFLQAVSVDSKHPKSEDALYSAAAQTYREQQSQFVSPKYVVSLIDHSKIWLLPDSDLLSGKPLPKNAATIDGYPIPLTDVIAKCMVDDGPRCTDMLVESYVVDRECKRRGVAATDAEIDRHIDELEKEIAPHTIDEALQVHHTTMEQLRKDFAQEIERTDLVIDQIPATTLVHCRVIFVKDDPNAPAVPMSTPPSTIADIQAKLSAGADFGDFAKQYPVSADKPDGDLGILYQGVHGVDTAVLAAGLALKKGEISQPIHAVGGWCLIQAISTADDHPADEDDAYATALQTYKEQEAAMRVPQYIVDLIKKSKVVYYVHA